MHEISFSYSLLSPMIVGFITLIILLSVAALILKGYALWLSARAGQAWWFIALLIINTFGILEIVYLVWYRPSETGATEAKKGSTKQSRA